MSLEIVPGVYLLKNTFVNIYLIAEATGLALIDTGIRRSGPKLVLQAIAELGREPADLKHILITHSDGDHTGGAQELKAATGATLYATPHDGQKMAQGLAGREASGPLGWLAGSITKRIAPIMPQAPDQWLEDGQELPVLGGLRAIFTPGHTPGHVSFYSPTRQILFAGDSLNTTRRKLQFMAGPFTWDFARGQESVRAQSRLGAQVVCCGHGEPLKGDLQFPY
jgi:glyoxylase-like metal-dependent hydrolase (beta-lactamase superfamily II)